MTSRLRLSHHTSKPTWYVLCKDSLVFVHVVLIVVVWYRPMPRHHHWRHRIYRPRHCRRCVCRDQRWTWRLLKLQTRMCVLRRVVAWVALLWLGYSWLGCLHTLYTQVEDLRMANQDCWCYIVERMKSVVWEMEEAMGSVLEVCLDSHIVVTHGCVALFGLHWFGVVLFKLRQRNKWWYHALKSMKTPSFPMVPDVNTNGGIYPIRCGNSSTCTTRGKEQFARLRLTRTTKNTIHETHVHVKHINNIIILSIFRTDKLLIYTLI